MLKKFATSAVLSAALAAIPAFAESASERMYHHTVSQVDTHGTYFCYMASSKNSNAVIKKQQKKLASKDAQLKLVFKVINLLTDDDAVKAQASSSISRADGVHVFKHFSYFGQGVVQPGSWGLFDRNAVKVNWDALPSDTILALSVRLKPGNFIRNFHSQLLKDRSSRALAIKIELLKKSGLDLVQLLSAVDGEIFLLVKGSTPADFGVKLVIPDRANRIAGQLKMLLPPAQNNVAMIPLPPPETLPHFKLQLHYQDQRLVFVSDAGMLNPAPGMLSSKLPLRRYLQYLPGNAASYALVNLNAAKRKLAGEIILPLLDEKARKDAATFLDAIPHLELATAGRFVNHGFSSTAVSNISLPDFWLSMPIKMFSFLNSLSIEAK